MLRRTLSIFVLMFLPAFAGQAQTFTTELQLGSGTITYDSVMFARPNLERLQGARKVLNAFVDMKCRETAGGSCIDLTVEFPRVHVAILHYAQFEQYVLDWFKESRPRWIEPLLNDGVLIRGLAHARRIGDLDVRISYFAMPNDELWVHELLHIIFPYDNEEGISNKVNDFLSSKMYKDWLRENY